MFSWDFAGFLRFRAGCHGLPVDVGRETGVPRLQRVCAKCHGPAVYDERHVVFECPAAAPQGQRLLRYCTHGCSQGLDRLYSSSCGSLVGVMHYVRQFVGVLLADGDGGEVI